MPGSWIDDEFPFLGADRFTITSDATTRYNCIAWAARDTLNNWWPDEMDVGFWPARAPREETIGAFVQAYETLGYKLCADGSLQEGQEKIAIFGVGQEGSEVPTHAARQLESGEWTSKLGPNEDISHKGVEDVRGPIYGKVMCYMSRPISRRA
jgi:hypothetical protein